MSLAIITILRIPIYPGVVGLIWFLYGNTSVAAMKKRDIKHLTVNYEKRFLNTVINALGKMKV
jgi:hypothetical protein